MSAHKIFMDYLLALFAALMLVGCSGNSSDGARSMGRVSGAEDSIRVPDQPEKNALDRGAFQQPKNAVQLIDSAFAQYGVSSPQAAMIYGVVSATCAPGAFPTKDAGSAAHREAVAKIKEACSGFDQNSVPKPGYKYRLYVSVGKNDAEVNAMEQDALETLRSSSAIQAEAVSAAWFLIEQGAFPDQESYGVSDERLAEAFGIAQSLKSCRVIGCGPDDLVTISLCARTTCPPSANYETAVSQAYSPSQIRLVQQLRGKTF